MPPMMRSAAIASSVPFVASENTPPSPVTPIVSTAKTGLFSTPASVTSGSRPLSAAKLIARPILAESRRRGVAFSPQNTTKEFFKDAPIRPSSAPPASIRSYAAAAPSSSPAYSTPEPSERSSSPATAVRPILKATDPTSIRIARTVREGSWANREPARLLVTGQRPRSMPRGTSSSLAQLCDTAEDGVAAEKPPSDDEIPNSDDSNTGEAVEGKDEDAESEEEPEEVECLHPASLVNVILEGADDLLTLEEAYSTLTLKIREVLYEMGPPNRQAHDDLEAVVEPIREEAPAIVRAVTRDLHRLMGKVPSSETPGSTTPFRNLQPERRRPGGLPSPDSSPSRKGYTAAEIRYRREASSVGAAVLRFLAAVFSSPRLFSSFTEANLLALLDQVIMIPRTPVLPTPTPKRTYSLALCVLAHLRFPLAWVERVSDKILAALYSGWHTLGSGGAPYAFKDSALVKRDAFVALSHLLNQYPAVFVPGYAQYLQTCLRTLPSGNPTLRRCASGALAIFVKVKLRLLQEADFAVRSGDMEQAAWIKTRALVQKTEVHVANFLKTHTKFAGKVYDADGDKYTEWSQIEAAIKQVIGKPDEVAWASSTWATLASLMGPSYNTFPLAKKKMNHIMNRVLQPCTSLVRPMLACTAWEHAIHAYLLAGSTTSLGEGRRIVRSYNPFSASCDQDATSRLHTLMFPFQLAITHAHNPENVTRVLAELPEFRGKRWSYQRTEKARKYAWMVTSANTASSLVYAFTTLALDHEEQSAKEMTKVSGMPSSDGVIADLTPEEERLPRLDRTFELVLLPILKQSFNVLGVDEIKNQAWSILEAITAEPDAHPTSLDRLLSVHYLSAEVVGLDLTDVNVGQETVAKFERDRISSSEIPAWGKLWVAKRLGKLLALFQDAFDGISGINTLSNVEWVRSPDSIVPLPKKLSDVWTNLLKALTITSLPDSTATPLFKCGLQAITRTLMTIFDRDPSSYVPANLLLEGNQSALHSEAVRLGIVVHLYSVALEVLGEKAIGVTHIDSPIPGQQGETSDEDAFSWPSAAGYLLKHVLRSKTLSQAQLEPKTRALFVQFVASLLKVASTQSTRVLGQVANVMPWIFETNEQLQLDVWRTLAVAWTTSVDIQPSETASKTNHTGELLVSLLSCPFRNEAAQSIWYSSPDKEHLDAWDALFKVTVLRFRAKRVGSNFGVLETLAAHFGDFIDSQDEQASARRLSSSTTLHCLAVAMSSVALVPTQNYHAAHFSINENYVPADFLAFGASALDAAYPTGDAAAVTLLVESITDVCTALPSGSVHDVLEPLHAALAKWMTDSDKGANEALAVQLDKLYIAVLGALSRAIEDGHIAASSESVNGYIDLYAPRLSCGTSSAVPAAFQDFWRRSFQGVSGLDYSDDVAGFLRDVLTAVPGLILVEDLSSDESLGVGAESFPFAESVPLQVVEDAEEVIPDSTEEPQASKTDDNEPEVIEVDPTNDNEDADVPTILVDATTEIDIADINATGYDADVSQSVPRTRSAKRKAGVIEQAEPAAPAVAQETEQSPHLPSDVFGPNKATKTNKGKHRRTGSRSLSQHSHAASMPSRHYSRSPSPVEHIAADTTIIPDSDIENNGSTPPYPYSVPVVAAGQSRGSLFASAGRWLRRVPSIGALFTPGPQAPGVSHDEYILVSASAPERGAFALDEPSTDGAESACSAPAVTPVPATKTARRRHSKRVQAASRSGSRQASVESTRSAADGSSTEVSSPETEDRGRAASPSEVHPEVASDSVEEPTQHHTDEMDVDHQPKQPTPEPEADTTKSQPSSQRRRSRRQAKQPPSPTTEEQATASEPIPEPIQELIAEPIREPPREPTPAPEPEESVPEAIPIRKPVAPSTSKRRVKATEPVEEVEPAKPAEPQQPEVPVTRATARRKRPLEAEISTTRTTKRARQAELAAQSLPTPAPRKRKDVAGRATRGRPRKSSEPPSSSPAPASSPVLAVSSRVPPPSSPSPPPAPAKTTEAPVIDADVAESPSFELEPTQQGTLESGVFDDAPDDETPRATDQPATPKRDVKGKGKARADAASPVLEGTPQRDLETEPLEAEMEEDPLAANLESPHRRSTAQNRLLALLDEAARNDQALRDLDFDGIVAVLSSLDRLRSVATANLQARAQEARHLRRSRSHSRP